ncbi:MAG: hypothetical protein WCC17_05085 [Candidatus Nitrosopolaris sp.]
MQVKAVLEYKGYKQIRDYSDEVLYYMHQQTGDPFVFLKSNNMTVPYYLTILRRLKMDDAEFERIYKKQLQRSESAT